MAIAGAAGAISDATVTGIDIAWRWTIDEPAAPAESSNIERKLLMLMVNDAGEINGMIIPSPRADLWETTGSYAGIRLDMSSAGALAWIAMLASIELVTPAAHELGALAVGGLAL